MKVKAAVAFYEPQFNNDHGEHSELSLLLSCLLAFSQAPSPICHSDCFSFFADSSQQEGLLSVFVVISKCQYFCSFFKYYFYLFCHRCFKMLWFKYCLFPFSCPRDTSPPNQVVFCLPARPECMSAELALPCSHFMSLSLPPSSSPSLILSNKQMTCGDLSQNSYDCRKSKLQEIFYTWFS